MNRCGFVLMQRLCACLPVIFFCGWQKSPRRPDRPCHLPFNSISIVLYYHYFMTMSAIGPSNRSVSVESFKVMDVLRHANQLEAQGRTIYHCEVGQPETGAPPRVAEAAIAALSESSKMGYTDAFGLLPLRQKISNHYSTKYKNVPEDRIGPDRIVVTTGSSGGFLLAFTACFDVGDVIAIASSGYPCYRNILQALGCELANVVISQDFKLTARELQKEIQLREEGGMKKLKGLILSSPSNPTGAMLSVEELKDLCELCEKENIRFLSDEIYHGEYALFGSEVLFSMMDTFTLSL